MIRRLFSTASRLPNFKDIRSRWVNTAKLEGEKAKLV